MIFDEQQLHQRLAAAADQASPLRFTISDLTSRIRRRRAKILGIVSGSLLAVAAIVVAVSVALIGTEAPPIAHPWVAPFRLSFTVTVNAQSQAFPKNGLPPSFAVTPGKHLRMNIGVIVPSRAEVTTLWLGIVKSRLSTPGRNGQRPIGMHPVLAHTQEPLTSGLHTFRLTLTMPLQHGGTPLLLVAAWATRQQDASVAQPVAELDTPR